MNNKNKVILSFIGVFASVALLVISTILAENEVISAALAVVLTIISIISVFVAIFYAAKVDYETGVYECRNCGHTFKPTFKAYILAVHTLTTRCLKCPECGKSTRCKRRNAEKGE
ncbi:MAG: hypothetical protein IJP38_04625 [Oscillospiraceae bacterium]|nr:hypothetical protein [Oscillospiraceae bacterium]